MTGLPHLTPKQEKFAREYVKTGNGALAARAAGYSPESDRSIASENLTKPDVSEAIKILRNRLAEKLDISREKLINNAAHIAEQSFADKEYAPAIKATELILKAQGYLIERSMNVSVDVTQAHLEALQQYTDRRIDEALRNHKATAPANITDVVDDSADDVGVEMDADSRNEVDEASAAASSAQPVEPSNGLDIP